MLRMLRKNKKAQNTAEYAILIALVVGAVIAMQTYAQRAMQGRLRDASVMFRDSTNAIGNTLQYEPYYVDRATQTDKAETETDTFNSQEKNESSTQLQDGHRDITTYDAAAVAPIDNQDEGVGEGM